MEQIVINYEIKSENCSNVIAEKEDKSKNVGIL
jgi:hypothetical protein